MAVRLSRLRVLILFCILFLFRNCKVPLLGDTAKDSGCCLCSFDLSQQKDNVFRTCCHFGWIIPCPNDLSTLSLSKRVEGRSSSGVEIVIKLFIAEALKETCQDATMYLAFFFGLTDK
ncbi:hypothetical protein CEXT_674111 [Caerostris extrusa]|uniref:Uncharacterized protein n=1 Tax=Caerostris extrusa TaxID=172846 RepID=A0AAV4UTN4_CAEEX|nr:hypothetical protein CEXT_674111 [Caerostris extrusa]